MAKQIYTIGRCFYPQQWSKWREFEAEKWEHSPIAKARQEQIKQYCVSLHSRLAPENEDMLNKIGDRLVNACKTHEELNTLGLKFRKGKVPQFNAKSDVTKSFAMVCFMMVARETSNPNSLRATAFHHAGYAMYEQNRYEEAAVYFKEAEQLGSKKSRTNLNIMLQNGQILKEPDLHFKKQLPKFDKMHELSLQYEKITPQDIQESRFTQNQLEGLDQISRDIYEKTSSSDLIVFLGRSPTWPAEMFENLYSDRPMCRIPFSGGSLGSDYISLIKDNEFKCYWEFLQSKGLKPGLIKNGTYKRVVIIDGWEKGTTLIAFRTILHAMPDSDFRNKVFILALIQEGLSLPNASDFGQVETIGVKTEVLEETAKKHWDKQIYTIGRCFYPEQWTKWQEWEAEKYEPSPIAKARQEQIREYGKGLKKTS